MLSLGAVHSFALEDVVRYLSSKTVRTVLTQAVLDAPVFGVYWRWNASTALAVRRFRNGKKQPAQFQRMDAEDLLSTVFPEQLACAENLPAGDREIPDHPLVKQTLDDVLTMNMDVDGLVRVLERIEAGEVEVVCRELTSPSPLAQEILGAKPYAFLDDAPAEERRTLAVQSRRYMTAEQAAELGSLDPEAIERVKSEAWPQVLNTDELNDALVLLGFVTAEEGAPWRDWFERLRADGRATIVTLSNGTELMVSAERLPEVTLALPGATPADALVALDTSRAGRGRGADGVGAEPPRGARARDGRGAGAAVRLARGRCRDARCSRWSSRARRCAAAIQPLGQRPAPAAPRSGASGGCSRGSIATR